MAPSISERMSCAVSCGGHREIALLEADVVAEIARLVVGVGIGRELVESTLKPVL
jgi:hypothetical protein